jgi:hypothetical protein
MFFLYVKIMQQFQVPPPPVEIPKTKTEIYESSYTQKFLKTFEPENQSVYNSNIDAILYDRKELLEQLIDGENEHEKKWRKNILYETTPRGNIVMHYDIFKQGFAYYSDQAITYNILNVAAMKYCVAFSCRDFFLDENILTHPSQFTKILVDEEKAESDKKKEYVKQMIPNMANARLAKFKNYAIDKPKIDKPKIDKPKIDNITGTKDPIKPEAEPEYVMNKFINLGKTNNFSFIQKIGKPMTPSLISTTVNTQFDSMFTDIKVEPKLNYKLFKENKLKLKPTNNLIRPFAKHSISHSSWSMTDKEINPSPQNRQMAVQGSDQMSLTEGYVSPKDLNLKRCKLEQEMLYKEIQENLHVE